MHCDQAGSAQQTAHPSYRLVIALRLHIIHQAHQPPDTMQLQVWHKVVRGERDIVSSQNEKEWLQLLKGICTTLITRSQSRSAGTAKGPFAEAIDSLWEEERRVGQAILDTIRLDKTLEW